MLSRFPISKLKFKNYDQFALFKQVAIRCNGSAYPYNSADLDTE